MKFRFKVQNPSNNIDPNNFNCGTTYTDTTLALFSLNIFLNDVEIFNVLQGFLTSGSMLLAPVTVGPLTIHFHMENLVYARFDITGLTRDQSANLRIRMTSTDFETYDNTFKVFGFDMGNNPNVSYPSGMENYTKPWTFRLIPKNWLLPTPMTKHVVCASAIVFRDFFSGKIYIVKNNSTVGNVSYKLSGAVNNLAEGDYVEIDNADGLIENVIMTVTNGVDTVVSTIAIPSEPITEPVLGYTYTNPGCTSCLCLKEDTQVVLSANVGVVESYLIDDLLIDVTFPTINYNIELIDSITGAVVENIQFSNSPNPALSIILNNYTPGVDIDETVDYQIRYTLRFINISGAIFAQDTFTLDACSKIELTKLDCNIYQWVNKTGTVNVTLKRIDSNGVYTTIETHLAVALNTMFTFTLPDGVYILSIVQSETVSFNYKLISMCTFINCLTKYTEEIACGDPCAQNTADCGCADCQDTDCDDLNNFNLLAMTYMSLINKMYLENPMFITLDTESATTLQDLALIQDRISKYCNGCV